MSKSQNVRFGDPVREARENAKMGVGPIIHRHEGQIADDIPSWLVSQQGPANTTKETR